MGIRNGGHTAGDRQVPYIMKTRQASRECCLTSSAALSAVLKYGGGHILQTFRYFTTLTTICALIGAFSIVRPARGDDVTVPPSADDINQALASKLPQYWAVDKLYISASENSGDTVNPIIKQRFSATAKPIEPLFAPYTEDQGQLKPFMLIVKTLGPDETRTLYGVATSKFRAGNWTTDIELESSVDGLGRVRSSFGQPTIVLGSDRETEITQQVRVAKQAAIKAASGIEDFKANLERERQQLEHSQKEKLAALKDQYHTAVEQAVEARDKEIKSKIAQLEAQNQSTLDQLNEQKKKLDEELKQAVSNKDKEIKSKIAQLEEQNQPLLDELKEKKKNLEEMKQTVQEDTYDFIEQSISSGKLVLGRFDEFLDALPDTRKAQALRGALMSSNPAVKREAIRYALNSGKGFEIEFTPTKFREKGSNAPGSMVQGRFRSFSIKPQTVVDPVTGRFEFKCPGNCDSHYTDRIGYLLKEKLTLNFSWMFYPSPACSAEMSLAEAGGLTGQYTCENHGESGRVVITF